MNTKEAKKESIRLRKLMIDEGLWPCCFNCEHWTEVTEITDNDRVYFKCGKYDIIPPPETIVVGCIQHLPDIPF